MLARFTIDKKSRTLSGGVAPSAVFTAVFIACIVIGQRMMNMDGDLGRHLTVGEYILQNQEIPLIDHFSHTMAGAAFTPHEWLAEVIFALAYRLKMFSGVVWLTALVLAAAYASYSRLLYIISRRVWITLVLVIIAIAVGSLHFLTRPHIFSYLFFTLLLLLLQARIKSVFTGSLVFILFMTWSNTHGGFLYGLLYLSILLAAECINAFSRKWKSFRKDTLFYLLVAILGTMINPVGWKLYQTAFGFLSSNYLVRHTVEYLPPGIADPFGWIFFLVVTAIIVVFLIKRKKLQVVDVMQGFVWAGMGLMSARHIPIAVLVLLATLAKLMSHTNDQGAVSTRNRVLQSSAMPQLKKPSVVTNGLIIAGMIGCGYLLADKADYSFSEASFPVNALNAIRAAPPGGNMFNEFTWGGYILFESIPNGKVFIDGQTDFYGEKLAREYVTIRQAAPGWELLLDKYAVNWVILPPDAPLVTALRTFPSAWNTLYEDKIAIVLTRK